MRELSAEPTEGEKYKSQGGVSSSHIKKVALPPLIRQPTVATFSRGRRLKTGGSKAHPYGVKFNSSVKFNISPRHANAWPSPLEVRGVIRKLIV